MIPPGKVIKKKPRSEASNVQHSTSITLPISCKNAQHIGVF